MVSPFLGLGIPICTMDLQCKDYSPCWTPVVLACYSPVIQIFCRGVLREYPLRFFLG